MTNEAYTKERPLRVVTLCSGYDSQCMALERLKRDFPGFDYDCIAWAEIDRYAIYAHDAVFPQYRDRNMGDITSCDWTKITQPIDLLIYSTPCTSISNAGKQEGLKKGSGTASSIIWSVLNAIDVLKPKYLLMENVKALVSKKFMPDFRDWYNELASRGYQNFWKVLNAKDYCVPQNRERVFMVSILDENASFHFPEPFHLERRLKDILEEDVDERYYLSDKCVKGFMEHNRRHHIKEPIACAMRGREVYGSKHVNNLIESGKIPADEVALLDGYNQTIHTDVTATIKTNIDKENLMFVSIPQCLTPKRNEYGKSVRKKYEAGEIQESRHNMTDLVPREDGICNTITSVQKDCLIIELFNVCDDGTDRAIKAQYCKSAMANFRRSDALGDTGVIQIENILEEKGFSNPQRGRIYSADGISPTITTMAGDGLEPKIITQMSSGLEHNSHIVEVGNINPSGKGMNGRVVSNGGIAPTLSTNKGEGMKILSPEVDFRIRKLTEREVFRLMDVSEEDIDRIQAAGISRSQQYKMAGNSIVVACLYHIFRKLFVEQESESQQLTIF